MLAVELHCMRNVEPCLADRRDGARGRPQGSSESPFRAWLALIAPTSAVTHRLKHVKSCRNNVLGGMHVSYAAQQAAPRGSSSPYFV
jgi:hypothetical protein